MSGVAVRIDGDVAHLTLSRPGKRNALARFMHHHLGAAIEAVRTEPDVRFVVLRGAGGTFSAGGDLAELMAGLPDGYLADYRIRMQRSVLALRTLDQVVVSVVEGVAVGAGAALALAADIVVAARDSRWRFSFGHVGFVPDAGSTLAIARAAGLPLARDLLLTGRWLDAAEAERIGLIARTAAPDQLDEAVTGLLDELRQSPPISSAMTKDLLESLANADFAAAVRTEGAYQAAIGSHAQHRAHRRQRFGA